MSNPWSSLQAEGVEASDTPKVHPAYANYDDRGRPQAGFDLFMELPKVCFKCGLAADSDRELKMKVESDLATRLVRLGSPARGEDRVGAGRHSLRLPHCSPCVANFQRARKALTLSAFTPLVALAAIVVGGLIAGSLALVMLLLAIILVPIGRALAQRRFEKATVSIASLDGDGFILLTGVDPQAGEALIAASQGHAGNA